MRVWQLIDARAIGGIERHVATVTMALRRRGYAAEIVLLQRYDPSPWLRQLELDAIPYRTLDGHVSGLVKAMREEPPALVHTHGYKANILGRLVARALGIPVVSSFHAGETPAFPVSLYTRIDAACSGLATRIAVSQAIADQLPQPTQVVRNFVAVPQQAPREALPQRVGFIGRLSHEKGPDLFCEMAEQGPPGIEWHVWGDGPCASNSKRAMPGASRSMACRSISGRRSARSACYVCHLGQKDCRWRHSRQWRPASRCSRRGLAVFPASCIKM